MIRKTLIAIFLSLIVAIPAMAVDISTATFKSNLMVINNSGSDSTEFISTQPLSGEALLNGGFTDVDTLNMAVVESSDSTTSVPSQPPSLKDSLDGAVADDGGVQTTETTESSDSTINDMTLLPATPAVDDAYYFGSNHPFRLKTLNIGTAGVGSWTIIWEYYNSAWVPLTNVDDRTDNFMNAGTHSVSFDLPSDWQVQTVNGIVDKYWIRARVTAFTSVIAAPVGTQAWWETGVYILFNDALVANEQTTYILAMGSTVDLVEGQQFFPGEEGYTILDDPTLENATGYLIRIAAYIETDFTNPATSSILEKTGAVRIYNPADGTIRLRLNGGTDLDIVGLEDGYYVMDVYDDTSDVFFTIYEGGSGSMASVSVSDNANDWEIGTEGAASYYDHIIIGNPLNFLNTTQANFAGWAFTDTIDVATPDDGSLQLDGWKVYPKNTTSVCGTAAQRNHPDDWDEYNCFSFQEIGWQLCADVFGVAVCKDGSYVMQVDTPHASNRYVSFYQEVEAAPSQVFSMGAFCNADNAQGVFGVSIEFLNSSHSQISIAHNKAASTKCGSNSWLDVKLENQTAPALTGFVRFHLVAESTGIGSRSRDVQYDEIRANIGTTAVPTVQDPLNLITNGSFEIIYPELGDGISLAFDPTSVSSVIQTSVNWTETVPSGTVMTINFSSDDGTTWLPVENAGDSMPGITIGQDLTLSDNFRVQAVMQTDSGFGLTPILEDINMLILGTGAALDGWWQPNELIGDTLTDRSGNGNNASTTFPLPTNSADYQFITGSFVSTGASTIVNITSTSLDVVPEINEMDIISSDSDLSYLPFHDIALMVASNDIPVEVVWAIGTGVIIVFIGTLVMITMSSVAFAGGVMAMLTLFATQVGTDGIIPFWVFAFAAISIAGLLIWTHPKVSL